MAGDRRVDLIELPNGMYLTELVNGHEILFEKINKFE